MELLIEVASGGGKEEHKEAINCIVGQMCSDLEALELSPVSVTVLGDREILEPGVFVLSKIAGVYDIHRGLRPIARFYDETTAYRMYALLLKEAG